MTGRNPIARTRTVLQIEATECGAACLSMILQYYGQYVSLERLRMETDVSRDGCSAGNIVRAAGRRGLDCDGYEMDAGELAEVSPPCILWWEHNHFVVYEGTRGGFFYINDPAYGRRRVDGQTLKKCFSGIVLTFSPNLEFKDFPEYGVRPKTWIRSGKIGRFLRSFRGRALAAVFTGLLAAAAALTAAAALEHFPEASKGSFLLLPGICLLLYLGASLVSERQIKRMEDGNELHLSWVFLQRLFRMPTVFLEQRTPEDLVERVRRNDRISRFTAIALIRGMIGIGTLLLCILFAFTRSPIAGGEILIALSLIAALQVFLQRSISHDETRATICDAGLASIVFSGMGKLETIRNLDLGDRYAKEAIHKQHESIQAHRKLKRIYGREQTIRWIIYALSLTFAVLSPGIGGLGSGIGIDGLSHGTGIASWIILFLVLVPASETIIHIASQIRWINDDLGSTEDIVQGEIKKESDLDMQSAVRQYRKLQGNIRCRSVSFAYGAFGEKIVDDLNLYLPVGSSLAVTGSSGSGKSTVGKLFSGLVEPSEGVIYYDSRPVEQIPAQVISASIAVVEQKSRLLTGTIRDNITMWNPNISEEDIRQAMEDACVVECVNSRPEGLDTELGARGRGLSGGEQQRLEIARALATNPSILILDEAFSGVDDETTEQIMANIRRRGCTCIVMTHDPLLIESCGQLLELDEQGGGR